MLARTTAVLLVLALGSNGAWAVDAPAPDGGERIVFTKGTNQVVVRRVADGPRTIDCKPPDGMYSARFLDAPSLRIVIERPTSGIQIIAGGRAHGVAHFVKRADGGKWNNGKAATSGCWWVGDEPRPLAMGRLDDYALSPGEYVVHFGFSETAEETDAIIIIKEKDAKIDPLSVALPFQKPLALSDRVVNDVHPLLPEFMPRERVQALFLQVDPALFAYVKYDLDKDSVRPLFLRERYGTEAKKQLEKVQYPKKGEPVLLLRTSRGTLMWTADGSPFRLTADALVDAPEGKPAWPTEMRNLDLDLETAARAAPEKLRKEYEKLLARRERGEKCWRDHMKKKAGTLSADVKMYEVRSVNGQITEVIDYKDKVRKQADKKCKMAELARAEGKLLETMVRAYTEEGKKRLAEMAAR